MISTLQRRLRTAAGRIWSSVVEYRWILLSVSLASLGLVSLVRPIWDWVNLAAAFVSAALVGVEIAAHRREARRTRFMRRGSESFIDVEFGSRFELWTFPNGVFLLDRVGSQAMASGRMTARRERVGYVLPTELRRIGDRFRRQRLAENPSIFNGRVVGLDTDLGDGDEVPGSVALRDAKYFDHLASDIMAMNDVFIDGRRRSEFGRNLFIDRNGRPRDFGDSWLLNAVGASVLAITSDGRFVAVAQTSRNESSGELFAPSGSGSVEPRDYRGETALQFGQLAMRAALRELAEEAAIQAHEVRAAAFVGFGRWLNKSAKPEAFTLALLSIDSHEVLRRRVPRSDRPYTGAIQAFRFAQPLLGAIDRSAETMAPRELRGAMSVPLAVGIRLLVERANGPRVPDDPFDRILDSVIDQVSKSVIDETVR
ncbi:NUDIX hydrolase [Agromyces sp. MMS24-JH15]|uniref:NUDIX hydrolase n=1 Tax=Agromyces sp. MMS24-JH15 TaxID=3243765 RepID=UPI003747B223